MRCVTERASRAALTFLLVLFMVYLVRNGKLETIQQTQSLPLSLTREQTPAQGNDTHSTTTASPTPSQVQGNDTHSTPVSPTPRRAIRPYTVAHNKVYYLDSRPSFKTGEAGLRLSEAEDLQHLNYSYYAPEDRQYLEARVEVMVERARQVKYACRKLPLSRRQFPHLVWDTGHHVVWCPNYKVASTTWMINFLKLAHFNDDNPAIPSSLPPKRREELKYSPRFGAKHTEVIKLYPPPKTWQDKMTALRNSARVIIVRHPFTRILSAYRDKMSKLKPLPAKFKFRELQKSIIKKYRPPNSSETSPFPTFPEFVQHLIDFTASFTTAEEWRKKVNCWVPYWAQCNVCTMDYNVIIKLETMSEDDRFLITLSDMQELKKTEGEWRHLRNVSSTVAAPDFYRKLTTRQMLDLHQRYRLDFDLFGYTLDAYLPLATDALTHPYII